MTEEKYLKASEIHEKLLHARQELQDIEDVLSYNSKHTIVLDSNIGCAIEDNRTRINFKDEFDLIIALVKDIRKNKVEQLENKLDEI